MEAALTLPAAVLAAVGAALLFIASLQSGLVYIAAAVSADRVSANWNNSGKHPETGMFHPLQTDPLYWRWNEDGGNDWFLPAGFRSAEKVLLPADAAADSSVVRRKLAGASYSWPESYRGSSTVESAGFMKSVRVEAEVPLNLSSLLKLPQTASGSSAETILDPAELIRNIELSLHYVPKIAAAIGMEEAVESLSPWLGTERVRYAADRPLSFRHHDEAWAYLRTLVRGQVKHIQTVEHGQYRKVEAMDPYGVAHHAYIGVKSAADKEFMIQYWKDVELIRDGKVNGVVWHFFRRTGETDYGPTQELKYMLEKAGIIVIIHS